MASVASRPLDEEAISALTLFNTYLEADKERRKHVQKVKSAEKQKKRAAAAVRRLKDRKASADDLAAAEAAYRETVDKLNQLRQRQPDTGGKSGGGESGGSESGGGKSGGTGSEGSSSDNGSKSG